MANILYKILDSLPPDIAELVKLGYTPTLHKATGRWYLQKRIGKKISRKLVPKNYDSLMVRLKNIFSKQEGRAVQDELRQHMRLREVSKQTSKPILAKEIEDATWFHNLLHDLGKYAYHRLVKYVEWTPDDVSDYKKAFDKLADKLNVLMAYIDDAGKLEKVMDERDALELMLTMSMDMIDKLVNTVNSYKWHVDQLLSMVPDEYKTRYLNQIIVSRALQAIPQVVEGEKYEQGG